MKNFQWVSLVVVAGFLLGPNAVWAASISINDTSPNETITVSEGQFEGGFSVNGTLVTPDFGCVPGATSGTGSVTVPESAGPVSFQGRWVDNGQATLGSRTIYIVETCDPAEKLDAPVSDIITLTVSRATASCARINGQFISDLDEDSQVNDNSQGNEPGQLPVGVNPADVFVENGTPVPFSAAFLSGAVTSDSACPPEQ